MKATATQLSKCTPSLTLLFFLLLSSTAMADDAQTFISRLKVHHQDTLPITAFSLKSHFLNRRYRDFTYWDYASPNLHMSLRYVEVDFARRLYYDNDILYFAGGRLWDRVQFQSETESFFYERDATSLGKGVIRNDMQSFDRFARYNVMNLDFLAVRPLLLENDIAQNVTMLKNSKTGTTTLSHTTEDDSTVDYVFDIESLRLRSINHGPLSGRFVYSDYRTTRGLTYARSVYSYYDGATKPTYIKFNDHFSVIDRVDPDWLKLPEGYGPVLERGDGVLVSEQIAENLHLITDSSAVHNTLVQVSGDKLNVFGAAGSQTRAEKTIQFMHKQFPGKTIASVYVTHPHNHQIAGLKAFVDLGVDIRADEYTVAAIKDFPAFIGQIARFRFSPLSHGQTLDDANFYVLETLHAKRQSFVHFKNSRIIFQSQFLHIPHDNTIARIVPTYSRSFIEFIRDRRLAYDRIVGNYNNNNISVDVVNKTYEAHL